MVRALVPSWMQHAEIFVIGSISSSFLCVSYLLESFRLSFALTRTLVPNLDFHELRDYPVSLVPLRWNRDVDSNMAGLQLLRRLFCLVS